MAAYRVIVRKVTTEWASVLVDADTPAEAGDAGEALAREDFRSDQLGAQEVTYHAEEVESATGPTQGSDAR